MDNFLLLFKDYGFLLLAVSLVSYAIGGINFSILITTKVFGKEDIRNVGSGNAGFTNVLRTSGKLPAIITFLGDFLKGIAAVWFSIFLANMQPSLVGNVEAIKYVAYIASFMCVIGHIYPCLFNFKGGKGILTGWSVTLLIDWRIFCIIISVFLVILVFSKIVSLASIFAASSYPIATFAISYNDCQKTSGNIYYVIISTAIAFVTAFIVVMKHKSNILRLISGTEKKITSKE